MRSRSLRLLSFVLAIILALVFIPRLALADNVLVPADEVEVTAPVAPADEEELPDADAATDEPSEPVEEEAEVVDPATLEAPSATYVAQIGTYKYTTIEDAVARAGNGATITLLADCTASSTLYITNSITIDTNGFTLSNGFEPDKYNRDPLIKVTGALDVIGEGSISGNTYPVIQLEEEGCLLVGDTVTIHGTSECIGMFSTGYVIVAGGNVISDGGSAIYVVVRDEAGCDIRIYRGTLSNGSTYAPVIDVYGVNSTLEMRGGTITGGTGIQVTSTYVTVDIYDGTIDATRTGVYCLMPNSPVTIHGGSISGNTACIQTPDDYPYTYDLSVTGGTFSGPVDVTKTTGFIAGGTFDTTVPSQYLAPGYTQNSSGEIGVDVNTYPVFLVHNGAKSPKTSLANAVSAAQSGDTIVLRTNITQASPIDISGINATLDLAGFTVSYSGGDQYLFCTTNSGTLTVTDTSNDRAGAINFTSTTAGGSGISSALRADGGTVKVNAGTVVGTDYGISTQGTNSVVEVTGGAVAGAQAGIVVGFQPEDTATVSVGGDAVVQGDDNTGCGIFAYAGTSEVTITGGTVAGNDALVLAPSAGMGACTPAVSGGDFYGTVTSSAEGFVTGGTFDALDDAYVAEDYYKEPIDGGRVTVLKDVLVAELSATTATYDAADHTPTITVHRASVAASEAVAPDSVIWTLDGEAVSSLVNAGTYTATATLGDDSATAEFVIAPREIDEALPAQTSDFWTKQCTSTGSYDTSAPTYNGTALVRDTDFTQETSGDVNPYYGPSKVIEITYTGKGNFCGTATREVTFLAYQPSASEIRVAEIPVQRLIGESVEPSMRIQRSVTQPNGSTFWTNCDFKVEYENNTAPGTGTATATLEFPFYGVYTKDFQILDARALSAALTSSFELLQDCPPVTVNPLDLPDGTRYLPQETFNTLRDAHNAATEVFDAPQSQEQVDQAAETLATVVQAAQEQVITHTVDRSGWMTVAGDVTRVLSETIVSEDGKTYIDGDGNTQELVEGQKYVSPDDAQAFWYAAMLASEDYRSATTQREVNAAVTALQAAITTLEAATKTFVPSVPMYRLYNQWSGEHFYTADAEERDGLVAVGWTYECIGWYAPTSGVQVYRLYNPWVSGGDHHYTMDLDEYNHLVSVGWSGEGPCWFSDVNETVPVYREYNPYEFAHNHNYTADPAEHQMLLEVGWRDEGIGWYGV